ncbi:MAG: helix-turn-helix domain-containing protein [Actinobacteria bacterium]|nr:helix-turn-helix domain-containing protein [Actinomycetota bacterium]
MTAATDPQTADQLASLLAPALKALAELVAQRIAELQPRPSYPEQAANRTAPWMSIKTAARYLDWPAQRLYKLTARGEIPHYKHEGRLLFRRDELDHWLASYAEGARS